MAEQQLAIIGPGEIRRYGQAIGGNDARQTLRALGPVGIPGILPGPAHCLIDGGAIAVSDTAFLHGDHEEVIGLIARTALRPVEIIMHDGRARIATMWRENGPERLGNAGKIGDEAARYGNRDARGADPIGEIGGQHGLDVIGKGSRGRQARLTGGQGRDATRATGIGLAVKSEVTPSPYGAMIATL